MQNQYIGRFSWIIVIWQYFRAMQVPNLTVL